MTTVLRDVDEDRDDLTAELGGVWRDGPAAPPSAQRYVVCTECGYGAVLRRATPPCPMCRSLSWRERSRPRVAAA
ncbi:MAG TPA: hypothetical protein VE995_07255 [Gaiellaceae bacterium]|nr:hypothetical protein [Gaiellaceae bacterium]